MWDQGEGAGEDFRDEEAGGALRELACLPRARDARSGRPEPAMIGFKLVEVCVRLVAPPADVDEPIGYRVHVMRSERRRCGACRSSWLASEWCRRCLLSNLATLSGRERSSAIERTGSSGSSTSWMAVIALIPSTEASSSFAGAPVIRRVARSSCL